MTDQGIEIAIHVPTLVLAKNDDRDCPIEQVRADAAAISGVRLKYPGDERFWWLGDCRWLRPRFEDVGEHELKGVPDRWHLHRVVS